MNKEQKTDLNKTVVLKEESLLTKNKSYLPFFKWLIILAVCSCLVLYLIYLYDAEGMINEIDPSVKCITIADLKQMEENLSHKIELNKNGKNAYVSNVLNQQTPIIDSNDNDKIAHKYKIVLTVYKIQQKINDLKNIDNELNILNSLIGDNFNKELEILKAFSSMLTNESVDIVAQINELIAQEGTRVQPSQSIWETFFKIKKHNDNITIDSKLKSLQNALVKLSNNDYKYAFSEFKDISGDPKVDELKNKINSIILAQQACTNIFSSILVYD